MDHNHNHSRQVARIIAHAQVVAHFAARFDARHAAKVRAWSESPADVRNCRGFNSAAVDAARLLAFDGEGR